MPNGNGNGNGNGKGELSPGRVTWGVIISAITLIILGAGVWTDTRSQLLLGRAEVAALRNELALRFNRTDDEISDLKARVRVLEQRSR